MGTEFNKEQFDAIYPQGIENHYWTHARNKILYNLLTQQKSSKKILEVGCGRGIVIDYLLKKGLSIRGVELAEVPIEEKLQSVIKSGFNVFDLSSDECHDIDTIMLLDVIEHIEFPHQFLKELSEKFPQLKSIIITVPACNELFSNYDSFNGHFRRYNQEMLKNEFYDIPYRKIQMTYFFHSLYLPAKVLLNTSGKRAQVIHAPKGFFSKSIHWMLSILFYLEYLILPSKLKGTSLLMKIDI